MYKYTRKRIRNKKIILPSEHLPRNSRAFHWTSQVLPSKVTSERWMWIFFSKRTLSDIFLFAPLASYTRPLKANHRTARNFYHLLTAGRDHFARQAWFDDCSSERLYGCSHTSEKNKTRTRGKYKYRRKSKLASARARVCMCVSILLYSDFVTLILPRVFCYVCCRNYTCSVNKGGQNKQSGDSASNTTFLPSDEFYTFLLVLQYINQF